MSACSLRGQPAAADRAGQAAVQDADAAAQRLRVGLDRDHADPGPREHLRDPGTHGAEADDRHLVNLHGRDITVGARRRPAGTRPMRLPASNVTPGARVRRWVISGDAVHPAYPARISRWWNELPWPRPDRSNALDHVVVIMFENRSFDNLLGRLYEPGEVPSFEGVAGKDISNPIPDWAADRGAGGGVVPYGIAPNMNTPSPDPGEEYPHVNTQLFGRHRPDGQPRRAGREDGRALQRAARLAPAADDGRLRHRLHQLVRRPRWAASRGTTSTRRS